MENQSNSILLHASLATITYDDRITYFTSGVNDASSPRTTATAAS
jgi:hypothetical protein